MASPQVVIDVGFTSTGTSGVFTVGHPTLGQVGVVPIGSPDIWTTLPLAAIRHWSVKRGAATGDGPTLRYEAGTAVVELNDGYRFFDPENTAGPYVVGGVTQVEAMRRVRIRLVWNNVTYPLFYGYADDWVPDYQGNSWTYTTLTATDPSVLLTRDDRQAVAPVGAGEDSGARVSRILNAIGWPAESRGISTGDTTLQETTLEGSPLAEIQLVQDSEQGEFYFNASGSLIFRNRLAMVESALSRTSQVTFGDGGFVATGEIPYADAKVSTSGDTLVNSIDATRVGGVVQHAEDATSVLRYGPKSHARADLLMETDAGALQWAYWLRYQYATPARRFSRIEFNTPTPQAEGAFWPSVLSREFGDRVTVKRRPAGGGTVIVRDCFVRGVEYSSDGLDFKTAFTLQGADRYAFFRVGDTILGRVGMNAVAY